MRLRAVMHAAISMAVSGASICTLEFVTITELPAVVSGMKNIFVEARCEFCGGPESLSATWLPLPRRKLVEMRT